ncbi:MAG: 30S ribosomal protein S16 [Nitrospirae bacterium]|nr:MAG: 30S ribosomal protein S16 [Nitrospirota bacterium]
MVKIRLTRMGSKKRPFYRIVVADSRARRDGPFIEILGTYNPLPNPSEVKLDVERAKEWMRRGAQPTKIVKKLIQWAESQQVSSVEG